VNKEVQLRKLFMMLALLAPPVVATTVAVAPLALAEVALSKLGDLSDMRKTVVDTLLLVQTGKAQDANTRITDYETAWDENEAKLRPLDTVTWRKLDEASDAALSSMRYPSATVAEKEKDLSDLIALLDNPDL
jgi:hypothetical protein